VVDSHAHLGICEPPASELVAAARDAGVDRILTVGISEEHNLTAIEHAAAYPGVFACVGRHPNKSEGFDAEAEAQLAELATRDEVRAIGETGLDYHDLPSQKAAKDKKVQVFARALQGETGTYEFEWQERVNRGPEDGILSPDRDCAGCRSSARHPPARQGRVDGCARGGLRDTAA